MSSHHPPTFLGTTHTPPYIPSHSQSISRTSSNAGRSDPEESADDDSEDFLEPEDLDDPDASSASLNKLSPATPKVSSNSTNWPFNALTTHHNSSGYPGTFPDGHAQNHGGGGGNRRRTSLENTNDAMNEDDFSEEDEHIPASSLPHEILLHILRLLPPTALAPALRVCKAWCQCGVELLWHKPMFTSLPALYKMLQVLSHSSTQTFPYPEFVRRINFSNLTQEMSDKMLGKLLPCTRIERLTLTGCKNLSSQSMVDLLKQSKRLVALDLSEVENVDDQVIGALAENCSRLQGLNLTGCGKVSDKGLEKLAKGCPALRRIKLRKCDLITDVAIVLLSVNCPLLLEIDLGLCLSITSTSLQQLFRTSHNIRELCLNGCTSLTDEGFPDSNSLSLLTSPHHSSSYSSAQASPLPSSSSSSSSGGDPSRPSSPGPSPLLAPSGALIRRPQPLTSPPSLHSFDHLRYLDLTSLILLTDQAIAGIIKFMPKIRNLILAKCGRLTDESLYEICKVGKNLHYLHLGHVNSITDKAVTAIARSCTRLRYIDLACCNNLTDVSVLELAANLPRLKRIGLVRVTNITDASLDALHARTSLERIHLSYCSNLTVSGVNDLLQHLPRLTHLSLTEVQAFRKKVLQVFCRPPPKDFNDHQRRSFCVFSGRGVHDLRKYLRSLSPAELEILSQPDPPSDDDMTRVGNRGLGQQGGGGGGGVGANQQQIQQRMQGVNPGGPGGGGGTAAQVAQARIRLAQIAQARQTMGQNGNARVFTVQGAGTLGSPFTMVPPQTQVQGQAQLAQTQQSPLQPSYRTPRAYQAWLDQQSQLQLQQGGGGAGGASSIASTSTPSNLPHMTSFAPLPSSSRNGAGSSSSQQQQQPQQTGFNRPSLYRQNSLGLSGASQVGEESDYDFSTDLNDTETMHNIPILSVPSTTGSSNSMELDSPINQTASTSSSLTRPPRPRRATVTRTNYRSSGQSHRRGGGSEMEDDDEDGEDEGEVTGEEEDLTMGDT